MNKILVLSVALVAAAGISSGVNALASSRSSQAHTGLPARVKALESKVKVLRAQVTDLRGKQACLTALPVSQYGNGTSAGYYYTNDGGITNILTTALDVTSAGQPPGAYVARIDSGCVGASAKGMSASSYRVSRGLGIAHASK